MVKFVIEISEKEKKALDKSSRGIKKFFKRIKNSFQVKIVKGKK